jgi:hypothetical protein
VGAFACDFRLVVTFACEVCYCISSLLKSLNLLLRPPHCQSTHLILPGQEATNASADTRLEDQVHQAIQTGL